MWPVGRSGKRMLADCVGRLAVWIINLMLVGLLLSGCATSTNEKGLSSLGQEVDVTPLRGQSPEQIKQDDRECEAWTRATKGKDEPLPNAELRYAVCAVSRGYRADVTHPSDIVQIARGWHVSLSDERTLETVLTDWQACKMENTDINPMPRAPFVDAADARAAVACLQGRGYKTELYQ
jgi:hypothetical protein